MTEDVLPMTSVFAVGMPKRTLEDLFILFLILVWSLFFCFLFSFLLLYEETMDNKIYQLTVMHARKQDGLNKFYKDTKKPAEDQSL